MDFALNNTGGPAVKRFVDVFAIVKSADAASVAGCVQSVLANVQGCARIGVVAAELSAEVRRVLAELGCWFLDWAQVLGFDAAAIPGESAAREEFVSQVLRWELRRFASTASYLVVDASHRLSESTNLWADDLPVLFCENRFRFGHLMCFNYFFGQIPYPASPATGALLHLDRAVVEEMVGKISGRWKMPWVLAAYTILQKVPGTVFDAGQNYGHYLNIFRAGSFRVEAVKTVAPMGRPLNGKPVVRMSTLGHNGRFANQLYQYGYLRLYAKREGLIAECPPWIGCALFGHQATLGQDELPVYREDKGETDAMIRFDADQHPKDFELWGYFQDSRHWAAEPAAFRALFEPLPFLKKPLDEAIGRLRQPGQTLVAIHLRRGDFTGGATFWPAPEAWYLRWLERVWPTLVNPVLYVASDDAASVLPQFAAYCPKSNRDLNVTVNGAEFYPDFYVMSQCDVLAISNSTFSFAAAMMNQHAKLFARPDPASENLIAFDVWSSPAQLRKDGWENPTTLKCATESATPRATGIAA
jgi:hypothetical protein